MSGARVLIDPHAIAENTRRFARLVPGELMAVVKADGYGAGAELVARTALAAGADRLGVTSLAEALALRARGIDAPLLSWLNPVDADFAAAITADVELAVPGVRHLEAIRRAARATRRRARIHLQLDCGMAREGCPPALWPHLIELAAAAERRHELEVVGVMGHLSSADLPSDPANVRERLAFGQGLHLAHGAGLRPPLRHLAATSATLTQPGARHSMCRVGAGLVGIDPSGLHPLNDVFTLEAPVVDVRDVAAGTQVGYGHSWRAPEATRLALVAVGYADGIPRAAVPGAEVLVRGRRRPVVGLVSMDQLVIDLGDGEVASGEYATLFGPGDRGEPTIADWARWSGTIPHEIVTGIGSRVERLVATRHAAEVAR